jgi:hypothetical protein
MTTKRTGSFQILKTLQGIVQNKPKPDQQEKNPKTCTFTPHQKESSCTEADHQQEPSTDLQNSPIGNLHYSTSLWISDCGLRIEEKN